MEIFICIEYIFYFIGKFLLALFVSSNTIVYIVISIDAQQKGNLR